MKREKQLKEQLLQMRDNNWDIPKGLNAYEFALEMMDNIGSTDCELRDNLILEMLWNLISEKILTKEQIRELLSIALSDKHLFYKLGEKEDDSVFNRTFTVLIVRGIVYYHCSYGENLLSEKEMLGVLEDVISYVRQEKDLRGYVEGKGWGHAMGHSADTLREIALCNYITHDQLMKILEAIREKVCIYDYVYINEETERMTSTAMNAISRRLLSDDELIGWIRSFIDNCRPSDYPDRHYWNENVKSFLRSLYFRLKFKKESEAVINEIEQVQNSINSFYNNLSR